MPFFQVMVVSSMEVHIVPKVSRTEDPPDIPQGAMVTIDRPGERLGELFENLQWGHKDRHPAGGSRVAHRIHDWFAVHRQKIA